MMEAPSQSPKPVKPGFWANVWEALRGSRQDYTQGDLGRSILLLAVPMILEMVMESLFGIVDVFWVSSLGTNAIASVALTEAMLTIVFGVAIGLSMATTAMVARRIGEKDRKGAADAAMQAVFVGITSALVTALIGVLFAPRLLAVMGGDPAVVSAGSGYARMIFGGSAVVYLLFLNNAIFRGAGDAAIAMRVLWVANIINLILDPCLIFGLGPFPRLGLFGAAVASTTGRGIGVLFQFWVMFGGMSRVSVTAADVRVHVGIMLRLLRVSATGIAQFLVSTASWLGLVRIISEFGSSALAGYMIAIRVVVFVILPAWGLCNAAATLVGQSLGAGDPDRAEQAVYRAGFYNMFFLGSIAVGLIVFSPWIIRIFSAEPEVAAYGTKCLRYISYGYLFYAWGMVTVNAFNGAGDTVTPTLINLACQWFLQIPLAWALAFPLGMGATGVFLAITLAESVLAVVGVVLFRQGKWKRQKI